MLGPHAFQRHVANTDNGDVLACAQRAAAPVGHLVACVRHNALHVVQHAVLDHDDGIVVADRRDQAALGVVRRGRRHDAQARHVHEVGMEGLAVLGALPPAAADDGSDNQRNVMRAGEHVAHLGRHVHDLVHAQQHEIHALMDLDRPHAEQRRANTDTGHGVLGQRHVEIALGAELLVQAQGGPEHAARVIDPLPHHKDAGVARHLAARGLEHRLAVSQRAAGFSW